MTVYKMKTSVGNDRCFLCFLALCFFFFCYNKISITRVRGFDAAVQLENYHSGRSIYGCGTAAEKAEDHKRSGKRRKAV